MTPNLNCICCGCWVCYNDNFNRSDGDVVTSAPLAWIPPGLYNISGEQLVIDNALSVLEFNHEIDISNAQLYITKVQIINAGGNGQLALFVSMLDETNCYVGVYDAGAGEIRIYYVQGPTYPTDWYLLNSQVITVTPKWLEVTVDLTAFLVQVAVIDASNVQESCVAPYEINGGARVGIGRLNGPADPPVANIIVDNFSLCENICLKGCLIGYDEFDRDALPVNSLGPNWIEHETLDTDIQIVVDYVGIGGSGGGVAKFNATRKMFWSHPHPDGHTTMGVMFRVYPWAVNDTFPSIASTEAKWFKIYACVDDPNNPQEWVSALYDASNGHVKLYKAVGGVETELTAAGPNFPTGSGNILGDFYLCVNEFGKVTFYSKDPHYYTWVSSKYAYVTGLSGTYCGIECYGVYDEITPGVDHFQKTFLDAFAFIKTFHPGEPNIVEWTVGGAVEIGDKFTIGITDTKSSISEQITVIADNATTDGVAAQIFIAIVALDPAVYPVMRNVSWKKDEPNKIRAEDQSLFTGIAITVETDDTTADFQTFVETTLQEWIKGAYDCPPCPPVCGPCTYCTGDPPATPPETDTPERVRVLLFGCIAGDFGVDCDNYNFVGSPNPPNTHHPFPNFPGAFDCTNNDDWTLGFNGEYVLEGCACEYSFRYPTWYEYYYPDGGDMSADDTAWWMTCYPGVYCDGFAVHATIVQDTVFDPTGHTLFWNVYLQSGTWYVFWKSDHFPDTQCKYPRTVTQYIPAGTDPGTLMDYGLFPELIQIIPEGSVRL